MRLTKRMKWVISIILLVSIAVVFSFNFVASTLATKKLKEVIAKTPTKGYQLTFRNVRVNLLTMSVVVKDIELMPDSLLMANYKNHVGDAKNIFALQIETLRLRHIDIYRVLGSKIIDLKAIELKKPTFTVYTGGGNPQKEHAKIDSPKNGLNLERIAIDGIGGVDINALILDNFSLLIENPISHDTVLYNTGLKSKLEKIYLIKNTNDSNTYRLVYNDLRFDVENENFRLAANSYALSFHKFSFVPGSSSIQIDSLKVIPTKNRFKMAAAFKFRADVFDVRVATIKMQLGNLTEMLKEGNFYLSHMLVDGLDLKILRNKSLPFDESKRPLLPNELLKKLKTNINIDSIQIRNSVLAYEESNSDGLPPMKVNLDNLTVDMKWITSMSDSMLANRPMAINLNAMLEKEIPLDVTFLFPLHSTIDTFSYSGRLGSGKISIFNPILQSAAGVTFSDGDLAGIDFTVQANSTYAMGEMTMLYSNLKGEVLKKQMEESNRFFTWIANQVIKSDNPHADDKPRVVPIYFSRDMYKGFGNFAFKPLLSGVLATTIPTFDASNQRKIDFIEKTSKKDIRRRKRQEKRD